MSLSLSICPSWASRPVDTPRVTQVFTLADDTTTGLTRRPTSVPHRFKEHTTALEASLRCSQPRPCKQQANALQVDGPVATVRNAPPVTVTPVGLLARRCMGLWPSSAMVVAPELFERKCHWMGTKTTTMIAISSAFRRPSGSMRTIDIAVVLHRKEVHEEKTEDHYHGHAGEVFPELARTSIATDRFVLLSRPSSTHKINK